MKYENGLNKHETVMGIILIIIIFIIFPLACCKDNNNPKYLPDDRSYQYDGHL